MSFVKIERKKDPLPILALVGGMVAASLLEHAIETLTDNVMRPVDTGAELLSKIATYKLYKNRAIDAAIDGIRKAFFVEPRQDDTGYNIDYDKFREVMDKLMYATIVLETLVSEDASELTMEMLQESLSNSLQYGLGGMWALMSAYSQGYGIPQGLFLSGENDVHPYTLASLDAWTGQLKHFLVAQHFVRVKNEWETAHQHEIERWLYKGVELAIMPEYVIISRMLYKAIDMIERMADSVTEIVSVMLRRIHDLIYSLQAAYNDYQANILTEHEFLTIAKSIDNALDAIDKEMDNLLEDAYKIGQYMSEVIEVDNAQINIPGDLEPALGQMIYTYQDRFGQTLSKDLLDKVTKYIDALNEIRELSQADLEYTVKFDQNEQNVPAKQVKG